MIQLAWRFLMFQKDSALAAWYRHRTANAPSIRKTFVVAPARKPLSYAGYWVMGPSIEGRYLSLRSAGEGPHNNDIFRVFSFSRGVGSSKRKTWCGALGQSRPRLTWLGVVWGTLSPGSGIPNIGAARNDR